MMSRNNGNRHGDKLVSSDSSVVDGGIVFGEKCRQLCTEYKMRTGVELLFPNRLRKEVILWRKMRIRHKRQDFRHTESELAALEALCNWTLDRHHDLHGTSRPNVKLVNRRGE